MAADVMLGLRAWPWARRREKRHRHGALDKSWVSAIPCANSFTRLFLVTVIFPVSDEHGVLLLFIIFL